MSPYPRIKDVLMKDPSTTRIPNDGVANVEQDTTIQDELRNFVCEGEYAIGLERVLQSYLANMDAPEQSAFWVSGFYGSGKSHFLKMLTYLWEDRTFDNGVSARGLVDLPPEIADHLKELSTRGKQAGGLFAAAGVLDGAEPVELGLLAILFRAKQLSPQYHIARFQMYLRDEGIEDALRQRIEADGRDFDKELRRMGVSQALAGALIEVLPGFAESESAARSILKAEYPKVDRITRQEMLKAISDLLVVDGRIPCTLIVLDELQQHIGDNAQRSLDVQMVVEDCCKQFGGRFLFVASGQSALSETPMLQKLMGRFPMPVELSDADVETVIRKLLLAKKQDQLPAVQSFLQTHSGEIDRQLPNTLIGPRQEDQAFLATDYPILPVRQRFWERVLRAIDRPGTAAQLRNQLRTVHDALTTVADKPLGAVVPADFIFEKQHTAMKQSGILLRDVESTILKHQSEPGQLKYKLCALCFLIGQLPRGAGADIGVRATPDMLADLLVDDLAAGGNELRKQVPQALQELFDAGDLMQIGDEYRIQTPESSAWEGHYRTLLQEKLADDAYIAAERNQLLHGSVGETVNKVQILHGKSKVPRKLVASYGQERPAENGEDIPVWVRDGWNDKEATVKLEAQQMGTDSPTVTVFLPKPDSDDLRKAIASWRAAEEVIAIRGMPASDEGKQARSAMMTRMEHSAAEAKARAHEVVTLATVWQAGGGEVAEDGLSAALLTAATNSLVRLFPQFDTGDNQAWPKVVDRAKKGDGRCLDAVGWSGEVMDQPVCKAVRGLVAPRKRGNEVRAHFQKAPFGWPRDAVDGALLSMVCIGTMAATVNGSPVGSDGLDQTKIAVAEFRQVTVLPPTTHQRLGLRGLLQAAGIAFKPGEELAAIPLLLDKLGELASAAGGEPPLPARPSTVHLDDFRHQTGNEQAVAIADEAVRLKADMDEWKATAAKIAKRWPPWERLERLLKQAGPLTPTSDLKPQIDAISAQRALLQEPDPVAPLLQQLADALRNALLAKYEEYTQEYDAGWADLQACEAWQKITEEQRQGIVTRCDLVRLAKPDVGTDDALAAALERKSLEVWRMTIAALPPAFSAARLAAEKLLEPKLVHLKWMPHMIKSEADLEKCVEEFRNMVKPHLNAGENVLL